MTRTAIGRPARLLLVPLLAVTLPAALLLAGCGHGEKERAAKARTGAETPRRGGQIVTAWTAEPGGINEYTSRAALPTSELIFTVFSHLLLEQPDFAEHPPTFAPDLATSYEWSPDHKALTFHLRKDAVWSDGVPLTAEDVRWTWQAQRDPAVAWDNAFMKREIQDVEVVDPHTARFHFTRAYAKQMTDANEGGILPKHAWSQVPFARWRESADWFKQHAVFSGPFVIASWTPQQEVVLQRNERYFLKDRPYLDRVVMRITPDPGSALVQLLNGEVDFMPQVGPHDAPRIQADPHLRLVAFWSNLYVFVAWNNEDPLFADRDVRRALTLAIDRQAIVDTLWGAYGRVAVSPVIASIWAHDRTLKPLPYDPAEARRILETKGWKDSDGDGVLDRGGKPFAFELPTNAGNPQRGDAAVMIQEQLKKVGIRATPRSMEFNTIIAQSNAGKLPAMIFGLSIDTSLDLTGSFHSQWIPGPGHEGSNFERYVNPEIDRLLDRIAAEPDILKARPLLDQVQQILYRDQPVTFLWESQRLSPINKRIHGADPNVVRSFFNLKDWWVEPRG
jgi:peptide/nickel transport system substrate-binding protein